MTTSLSGGRLLQASLKAHALEKHRYFTEAEYHRRKSLVLASMSEQGLDLMLVSNAANISWLTGYQSVMPSAALALLIRSDGETICIVPDLDLPCFELFAEVDRTVVLGWTSSGALTTILRDLISERGSGASHRIGVELSRFDSYAGLVLDPASYIELRRLDSVELVDSSLLVSQARTIKSEEEISAMREAGILTALGLRSSIEVAAPGMTQNQIISECYRATIAAGSEMMPIDPMIVTGIEGGYMPFVPHTNRPVNNGDAVYLESSASAKRYSAPLMRTFTMGAPSAEVQQLAALSLDILSSVMEEIRPGRTGADINALLQPLISDIPEDTHFPGTFGYSCGLGLQPTWTDSPFYLGPDAEEEVQENMTLHLPICLWSPTSRIGVGFSETVVVRANGIELITPGTDRKLIQK